MRDIHLEWLFRIANEPSRCGRFIKSLDAITSAMEKRMEKILFSGINEEKIAYNQTDIL
jgi:UDP-N-acetyl-D-mannosaminuronic acid transferase (WecB/TagA/CpsF family)